MVTAKSPPAEPAPPDVPGYEILGPLGCGGMGRVYLARQRALGRLVALKILCPTGDEPEQASPRFRREAELMAGLSHPNILAVYDYGEADGCPYLVMEYVEAGDLRRRMREGQPMPIECARPILAAVGEALACLHDRGILHRDLKPENILMYGEAHPKVADFGIAVLRSGSGTLTRTGQGLGTPGYVAPEQQYRLKVDERADQYSLGALAYELLTGRKPLGLFKPPSAHTRRLDSRTDAVILRALKESPKERFATVRDLSAALDRALAEATARRRPARTVALGAAALLLAAGAAAVWSRRATTDTTEPAPARPVPAPAPAAPTPTTRLEAPAADTPSPTLQALTRARAEEIWRAWGCPTETLGEALKDDFWMEAERQIKKEVSDRAYHLWEARGRPTGTAGEAVRDEIWHEAEAQLLQERERSKAPDSLAGGRP
jgi:eukaryotic-like serine/threonine-protein kinase